MGNLNVVDSKKLNVEYTEKRNIYSKLMNYLNGVDSKICALYGLRRTGKSVLMMQCAKELLQNGIKSIYVECDKIDSMDELRPVLEKALNDGIKAVFLDEVTAAEDFQRNSSFLPNVYVARGIRIVIAGMDALNIAFARGDELYDRVYAIHTSYIPYAEYNRLLGKGIDDYIRYGGTLTDTTYKNNSELQTYQNTAIVDNIIHSIEKNEEQSVFPPALTELYDNKELKSAINKMIDKMCLFDIKNQSEMTTEMSEEHSKEIKNYLECLDLFIRIPTYSSYKRMVQTEDLEIMSQPGMVYAHATELIKELKKDKSWRAEIPYENKNRFIEKAEHHVKGIILENEIIANTYREYSSEDLYISKLGTREIKNGMIESHEADMVVLDTKNEMIDMFEVKYSDKLDKKQIAHLTSESFKNYVEDNFGEIRNRFVIYNGKSGIFQGISYINAEAYLKMINRELGWDNLTNDLDDICRGGVNLDMV